MSPTTHTTPTTEAERIAALVARPVVGIDDAATITGTSRSTIVRAIATGDLSRRKVGRRVLLATADVLAWAGA